MADERPDKEQQGYRDQGVEGGEQKLPAGGGVGERTRARPAFRPRVDIFDSDAGLVLVADIPGAGPEDLEITLEQGQLTIRADVKEHAPEGMSELYREYEIGDWECSFTLSRDFDMEKIEADLQDGVLTVTLPKAPEPEAKRIQVKAG